MEPVTPLRVAREWQAAIVLLGALACVTPTLGADSAERPAEPVLQAAGAGAAEDVRLMASEWLAREPMRGFPHAVSLTEAYVWQDRFAAELEPTLGGVVGYKTGGHDSGPHFRWFPREGIRGQLLEGMLRSSGTAIRPGDTRVGFLEADLAFRVGSDAINEAQTDLEILAGLDALLPFAEVPDPWYDPESRSIEGTIVANMSTRFSFSGEAVPLEASEDWLARLRACEVLVRNEHGDVVQRRSLAEISPSKLLFAGIPETCFVFFP